MTAALVDSGSRASTYVAELTQLALSHRAVRHEYLETLARHGFPDTRWAIRDFATHYLPYSLWFPRYLTTVVSRLDDEGHRQSLLENLTEESGTYNTKELDELGSRGVRADWVVGVPHPKLFLRFCRAVGAPFDGAIADETACWRELFLSVLTHGSCAEAVGALGLGTEAIVSTIYKAFEAAIDGLPELQREDTVFFPLHTTVDDHHQASLAIISRDLCADESGRRDLRRGMLKALSLRGAFWDWLHERALHPERSASLCS